MGAANTNSLEHSAKSKSLRFTVERDEARQAVGITLKQLRTWQEAGLFSPELGKGSRRFTESDVERLKFLRRLVLELGLPVSTVKELFSPFYDDSPSFMEDRRRRNQGMLPFPKHPNDWFAFLDIKKMRLVGHGGAFRALTDSVSSNSLSSTWIQVVEDWVMTLIAIRVGNISTNNPTIYKPQLDALFDRIRRVDLAARVRAANYDPDSGEPADWALDPCLPDDPELSQDELAALRDEHRRRVGDDFLLF